MSAVLQFEVADQSELLGLTMV